MTSPRTRKIIRWSLGVFIGLLVLLVVTVFALVRIIDTPSVRADLSQGLSEAVDGQVTWEALEIRFFPLPHGIVRNAHFEMPNLVKADVATVEVTLRMLPLFRGSAELKSITILQPSVDVWIADSPDESSAANDPAPPANNPLEIYRSVMRPILDGIANFAPDTTLAIDQGRVAIHVAGIPPFEASDLDLNLVTDAAGVTVDATVAGTYWDNVALKGRIEFADLSAELKLDAGGLKPQPVLEALLTNIRQALVLSSVGAKLEARTDGSTTIDAALELDLPKAELQRRGKRYDIVEVRVGGTVAFRDQNIDIALNKIHLGDLVPVAQASLKLTGPNHEPRLGIGIETLDLLRLRDALVTLVSEPPELYPYLARIRGGQLRNLKFETQAATLGELFSLPRLRASVAVQDGRMLIPAIELEASQIAAQVELLDSTLKAKDVSARLGASLIKQASAEVVFAAPMRLANTRAKATLRLDDLLPNLRKRATFAEILAPVPKLAGAAEVSLNNLALRFDQPAQLSYDITVSPRGLTLLSDQLPAEVNFQGGSARITPRAITIDRIGVGLFASKAAVSGELSEFTTDHPLVNARVTNGIVDSKLVDWIWQRADIAPQFKPATPIELTAQRFQWSNAGLDINAETKFAPGSLLGVDLSFRDKALVVRKATIKDRDSDAVITFAMRDPLLDFGFSGVLLDRTVAEIFGRAPDPYIGRMSGDFQLTVDRDLKGRSTTHGTLAGEDIELENVFALPIKVERFDLRGNGNTLDVRELKMDWAEQKIILGGGIAQQGPDIVLDLDLQSPGVNFDSILSAANKSSPESSPDNSAPEPVDHVPTKMSQRASALWALPFLGKVTVHSNYLEYEHYRVEGVRALASLHADSATISVTEGTLCGVSLPLTVNATAETFDASLQLSAKNQSLGAIAECLHSEHVSLTGHLDLDATLATHGAIDEIAATAKNNLAGSLEFQAHEGEIRKLALLGNILSLKAVGDLLKGDVKLGDQGFKYRDITVRAKVGDGAVTIEQGSLDSPALGVAATGTIQVANYESRLSVLVAPFGRLDSVARKIPIVGYVVGGALTSIPVGVSGDIRDPLVVPLGPSAIGSEVLGIFERTFKLPGKMVEPLTKPKESKEPTKPKEANEPKEK